MVQAGTGALKPRSSCSPSGFSSKARPRSRRVDAETTAVSGSAIASRPRREIGRVADHAALARLAFAEQLADDDEAGRDPEPHLQGHAVLDADLADGVDQSEARARGARRVVLMGTGKAEIDGRAVAEIFGDVAVETRHGGGDRALKCADQIAHVLRIELGGEGGRADEVAEHHRELTAIGGLQWLDRIAAESPDRTQDLQPMPERKPPFR
jgi:hypothetical protein